MSLLALDKWSKMFKAIRQNGGLFKSLYKMWRYDTLKLDAQLKGTDSLGNRYYENTYYMIGRSRWVEYADNVRWDYDASQVSPEWYGWLHYKTDCLPHEDCAKYCIACCAWYQKWLLPPQENMTGTEKAYYPYSTVRAHIHVWDSEFISNWFGSSIIDGVSRLRKLLPESRRTAPSRRPVLHCLLCIGLFTIITPVVLVRNLTITLQKQ